METNQTDNAPGINRRVNVPTVTIISTHAHVHSNTQYTNGQTSSLPSHVHIHEKEGVGEGLRNEALASPSEKIIPTYNNL